MPKFEESTGYKMKGSAFYGKGNSSPAKVSEEQVVAAQKSLTDIERSWKTPGWVIAGKKILTPPAMETKAPPAEEPKKEEKKDPPKENKVKKEHVIEDPENPLEDPENPLEDKDLGETDLPQPGETDNTISGDLTT